MIFYLNLVISFYFGVFKWIFYTFIFTIDIIFQLIPVFIIVHTVFFQIFLYNWLFSSSSIGLSQFVKFKVPYFQFDFKFPNGKELYYASFNDYFEINQYGASDIYTPHQFNIQKKSQNVDITKSFMFVDRMGGYKTETQLQYINKFINVHFLNKMQRKGTDSKISKIEYFNSVQEGSLYKNEYVHYGHDPVSNYFGYGTPQQWPSLIGTLDSTDFLPGDLNRFQWHRDISFVDHRGYQFQAFSEDTEMFNFVPEDLYVSSIVNDINTQQSQRQDQALQPDQAIYAFDDPVIGSFNESIVFSDEDKDAFKNWGGEKEREVEVDLPQFTFPSSRVIDLENHFFFDQINKILFHKAERKQALILDFDYKFRTQDWYSDVYGANTFPKLYGERNFGRYDLNLDQLNLKIHEYNEAAPQKVYDNPGRNIMNTEGQGQNFQEPAKGVTAHYRFSYHESDPNKLNLDIISNNLSLQLSENFYFFMRVFQCYVFENNDLSNFYRLDQNRNQMFDHNRGGAKPYFLVDNDMYIHTLRYVINIDQRDSDALDWLFKQYAKPPQQYPTTFYSYIFDVSSFFTTYIFRNIRDSLYNAIFNIDNYYYRSIVNEVGQNSEFCNQYFLNYRVHNSKFQDEQLTFFDMTGAVSYENFIESSLDEQNRFDKVWLEFIYGGNEQGYYMYHLNPFYSEYEINFIENFLSNSIHSNYAFENFDWVFTEKVQESLRPLIQISDHVRPDKPMTWDKTVDDIIFHDYLPFAYSKEPPTVFEDLYLAALQLAGLEKDLSRAVAITDFQGNEFRVNAEAYPTYYNISDKVSYRPQYSSNYQYNYFNKTLFFIFDQIYDSYYFIGIELGFLGIPISYIFGDEWNQDQQFQELIFYLNNFFSYNEYILYSQDFLLIQFIAVIFVINFSFIVYVMIFWNKGFLFFIHYLILKLVNFTVFVFNINFILTIIFDKFLIRYEFFRQYRQLSLNFYSSIKTRINYNIPDLYHRFYFATNIEDVQFYNKFFSKNYYKTNQNISYVRNEAQFNYDIIADPVETELYLNRARTVKETSEYIANYFEYNEQYTKYFKFSGEQGSIKFSSQAPQSFKDVFYLKFRDHHSQFKYIFIFFFIFFFPFFVVYETIRFFVIQIILERFNHYKKWHFSNNFDNKIKRNLSISKIIFNFLIFFNYIFFKFFYQFIKSFIKGWMFIIITQFYCYYLLLYLLDFKISKDSQKLFFGDSFKIKQKQQSFYLNIQVLLRSFFTKIQFFQFRVSCQFYVKFKYISINFNFFLRYFVTSFNIPNMYYNLMLKLLGFIDFSKNFNNSFVYFFYIIQNTNLYFIFRIFIFFINVFVKIFQLSFFIILLVLVFNDYSLCVWMTYRYFVENGIDNRTLEFFIQSQLAYAGMLFFFPFMRGAAVRPLAVIIFNNDMTLYYEKSKDVVDYNFADFYDHEKDYAREIIVDNPSAVDGAWGTAAVVYKCQAGLIKNVLGFIGPITKIHQESYRNSIQGRFEQKIDDTLFHKEFGITNVAFIELDINMEPDGEEALNHKSQESVFKIKSESGTKYKVKPRIKKISRVFDKDSFGITDRGVYTGQDREKEVISNDEDYFRDLSIYRTNQVGVKKIEHIFRNISNFNNKRFIDTKGQNILNDSGIDEVVINNTKFYDIVKAITRKFSCTYKISGFNNDKKVDNTYPSIQNSLLNDSIIGKNFNKSVTLYTGEVQGAFNNAEFNNGSINENFSRYRHANVKGIIKNYFIQDPILNEPSNDTSMYTQSISPQFDVYNRTSAASYSDFYLSFSSGYKHPSVMFSRLQDQEMKFINFGLNSKQDDYFFNFVYFSDIATQMLHEIKYFINNNDSLNIWSNINYMDIFSTQTGASFIKTDFTSIPYENFYKKYYNAFDVSSSISYFGYVDVIRYNYVGTKYRFFNNYMGQDIRFKQMKENYMVYKKFINDFIMQDNNGSTIPLTRLEILSKFNRQYYYDNNVRTRLIKNMYLSGQVKEPVFTGLVGVGFNPDEDKYVKALEISFENKRKKYGYDQVRLFRATEGAVITEYCVMVYLIQFEYSYQYPFQVMQEGLYVLEKDSPTPIPYINIGDVISLLYFF